MKFLAVLFLALFVFCPSVQAEDWQHWASVDMQYSIDKENAVSLMGESYFRENMSDDYAYLSYLSYEHTVGSGFSLLGQGYLEAVEDQDGDWEHSEYAIVAPVYKHKLGERWQVKAQLRFFYKLSPDMQWEYYRPRLSLIHKRDKWSYVLEDEMRLDLTDERDSTFFRNRIFFTCFRELSNTFSVGVGYLRQEDKVDGDWIGFNGMRTLLKLSF